MAGIFFLRKKAFAALLLLLISEARAQNFRNQQGLSLAAGISRPGDFRNFLDALPEPGTLQFQTFSWEAGFLRIRSISTNMAFLQGITIRMAGNRFHRNAETWTTGNRDTVYFTGNRQQMENYSVYFPFRWSFFLNRGPLYRWFLGAGFGLSIPVFEIHRIRGNDRTGNYYQFTRQNFPEKGPYAFLCPELECGFQTEFPDCSLLRISLFGTLRTSGLFKSEENYTLEHFSGLRFCWFFGND